MEIKESEYMQQAPHEGHRIKNHQKQSIELELVLLRHGHTQWNTERRYLGRTDLPLLPGAVQELASLVEEPALCRDFWRVYCSDLLRCRETLAAAAPHLEQQAVYDSRLREMDFGIWEGCTYEQLKDNRLYRSWIDQPEAVTPNGGEAWDSFTTRVDEFWAQLEQEADIAASGEPGGVEDCTHVSKTERMEDCTHELRTERMEDCTHVLKTGPSASGLLHHPKPALAPPSPRRRVLLVTHGGVIRLLLARLNEGVTFYSAAAPAPGGFIVLSLRRDGGQWRVITHET